MTTRLIKTFYHLNRYGYASALLGNALITTALVVVGVGRLLKKGKNQ